MAELVWRKSTRSGSSVNCVEIAQGNAGSVWVRDSKDQAGARLSIAGPEWCVFLKSLRMGNFDDA